MSASVPRRGSACARRDLRDLSRRTERAGIGLGLRIVRDSVEAHGGTVRVDALAPGQGAAFVIELPRSCS